MAHRTWLIGAATVVAMLSLLAFGALSSDEGTALAGEFQDSALAGEVTSDAEGRMEGVLVKARREGSNMTVAVVSNADGVYSFPSDRLEPGVYDVRIRAAGYVLRPTSRTVEVTGTEAAVLDLDLDEAEQLEEALQLSSGEWLTSFPVEDEDLYAALRNCTRCHSQSKGAMSTFDADRLAYITQRMFYTAGSTPESFQIPESQVLSWGREDGVGHREPSPLHRAQAEIVAQVNLSDGVWDYPFERYDRPSGAETKVIYTLYDLPRVLAKPHDVQTGPDGWIYYNDFADNVVGKLNPETGETQEWRYPNLGEDPLTVVGNRVLIPDGQGRFYINTMGPGYLVVFDANTESFEFHADAGFTEARMMDVDGYAWMRSGGTLYRVQFEGENGTMTREAVAELGAYDHYVDSRNNVFGAGRGSTEIWRVDAETLEVSYYPIPEEPRGDQGFGGGMRRGTVDGQDRLWWGGFDGNFVGRLDLSRSPEDPDAIELFPVPMEWFQPYQAAGDDAGYVWTGSISSDHVARMNEETGEWNLYLLPAETNLRHLHVERSDEGPSSLWVGMNHQARIVHVQPLEH